MAALLAFSACDQPAVADNQAAIRNAMAADQTITRDYDDRADRLDEKAGELGAAANAVDPASARALRKEADDEPGSSCGAAPARGAGR